MNLQFFYDLKEKLNEQGLVMTPGLTYESGKLQKVFSSIQRVDGCYLNSDDFTYLQGQEIMVKSPYIENIIKEFTYLCGVDRNESVIIFSQENLEGSLVKLFFETEQSPEEMYFSLEMISKYYKFDFDFSVLPFLSNPLYGLTIDIKTEKIVNFKVYLETQDEIYFDKKLLSYKEIYPYLVMYSYKNNRNPSVFEYWSFSKNLPMTERLLFTQQVFGISIPNIDNNVFEYKEFQYSKDDPKMNFYLFDQSDPISRAKNDE